MRLGVEARIGGMVECRDSAVGRERQKDVYKMSNDQG